MALHWVSNIGVEGRQTLYLPGEKYFPAFLNNILSTTLFFAAILTLVGCSEADRDLQPEHGNVDSGHPFLIVTADQYDDLRNKAAIEPWKSMKADAINRSDAGVDWKTSNSQNAYSLQKYIGAAALAYVLDVDRAELHATRVKTAILEDYSRLELIDGGAWSGVVPNLGSFFVAILSLDIVYDALTSEEVQACEDVISKQIFKISREGSWADVRRGTHGTWDVYKGLRTEPDDAYHDGIMMQVTEDGVSPVTIHYAWERVGGGNSRISKSGYMDVLEFTGIDRRYYNSARLKKFYRWLFGLSVNTAKEMAIIGDMLPTQNVHNDMLHRRVVNFDGEAAEYAAWFHKGVKPIGNILTYMIPKEALPPPKTPVSQIYTDGGAFFRERPDDPNGLHAVLYNIKGQDEWHTHHEVNGLAFSAYRNRLLVNGGRLGAPVRAAQLNNTLTLHGANHNRRVGGGITEGFTCPKIDYATGFSGPAIQGGSHFRSLIMIHAADGAFAYALVFDEVKSPASATSVQTYFHPANESSVTTVSNTQLYEAKIDHYPSSAGAHLTFFYATPPLQVLVEKVPSAVPDRYPNYPDHNRLEATYQANPEGYLNIVTVLFPSDIDHPAAVFRRISDQHFTGGRIIHGEGLTDVALESRGDQKFTIDSVSFQAKSMLYRESNDGNAFFFARKGIHFFHGDVGFDSENPVSIYFRGSTGAVITDGTVLTLRGPIFTDLNLNSDAVILERADDFITIQLPKGTYYFN